MQMVPKPHFTPLPRVCGQPGANSATSLLSWAHCQPLRPFPPPIATGRQWWAGPAFVRGVRPVNLRLGQGGACGRTRGRKRGLHVGTDDRGLVRVRRTLEAGGLRSKSLKQALGSISSECRFELLLNLPKICVS